MGSPVAPALGIVLAVSGCCCEVSRPTVIPPPSLTEPVTYLRCAPTAPPPTVDSITPVVPELVVRAVAPDAADPQTTRFEIAVRLWHGTGAIAECENLRPVWSATEDWVQVAAATGHRATVEVTDPPDVAGKAYVRATMDDASPEWDTVLTIVVDVDPSAADQVVAAHDDGAAPSAALVRGTSTALGTGVCVAYEPFALVQRVYVGNLQGACDTEDDGRVAVFATDRAMVFDSAAALWTTASDSLDVRTTQAKVLQLPVALWIGMDRPTADEAARLRFQEQWHAYALADLALANALLRANRTGISLTVLGGQPEPIEASDSDYYGCATSPPVLGPDTLDSVSGVLNVYYVNKAIWKGLYCERSGTGEPVIFIDQRSLTTALTHEVGHALALIQPSDGHTNGLSGFTSANLMWTGLDDTASRGRSQFTLGQTFRMNADSATSWLYHAVTGCGTATACPLVRPRTEIWLGCQTDPDTASPCPALVTDIAKPTSK